MMTLGVWVGSSAYAQNLPLSGIYQMAPSAACHVRFNDPDATGRVKIDSTSKNLNITLELKNPVYGRVSAIDSQYRIGTIVHSHLGMGQSIYINEYSNAGTRFTSQFRDTFYDESERPFVTTIELERVGPTVNLNFVGDDSNAQTCQLIKEAL